MDWNWDWDRDRDNDKDKGRDRDNRIYALYSTFFYFAIHFLFRPPRPIYWYPSTTETQLRGILSDVVHFGEPFKYSFIARPIIFIWVKAPNGRFSPRISGKLRISGFVICSTEKVAAFSLSARAQDNRTHPRTLIEHYNPRTLQSNSNSYNYNRRTLIEFVYNPWTLRIQWTLQGTRKAPRMVVYCVTEEYRDGLYTTQKGVAIKKIFELRAENHRECSLGW